MAFFLFKNCGPSSICGKCRKNESKYGKPSECRYCGCLAGFVDRKCVYCAHAERKLGLPKACDKCGLHAAFAKSRSTAQTSQERLCRFCKSAARSSSDSLPQDEPAIKRRCASTSSPPPHSTPPSSAAATCSGAAAAPVASAALQLPFDSDSLADSLAATEKLRDRVHHLQQQVALKDKIAQLNTRLLEQEKEHRAKSLSTAAYHEETLGSLRQQNRQLGRQLAAMAKASRKASDDKPSTSVDNFGAAFEFAPVMLNHSNSNGTAVGADGGR